jgi:hypothetical protein
MQINWKASYIYPTKGFELKIRLLQELATLMFLQIQWWE